MPLAGWTNEQLLETDPNNIPVAVADRVYEITEQFIPAADRAAFFATAQADGRDIRVTLGDNTTVVPMRTTLYDAANQVFRTYARLGTWSNVAPQQYYIHWGNATAPVLDTLTWPAKYTFAADFNQDPNGGAPQFVNHVTNITNGTANGTWGAGSWAIDGPTQYFIRADGVRWINFGNSLQLAADTFNPYTTTIMVAPETGGTTINALVGNTNNFGSNWYFSLSYSGGGNTYSIRGARRAVGGNTAVSSFTGWNGTVGPVPPNVFEHIAWHFDLADTTNNRLYVCATEQTPYVSEVNITTLRDEPTNPLRIMARGNGVARELLQVGRIAEVRVYNTKIPVTEIQIECGFLKDPTSLLKVIIPIPQNSGIPWAGNFALI